MAMSRLPDGDSPPKEYKNDAKIYVYVEKLVKRWTPISCVYPMVRGGNLYTIYVHIQSLSQPIFHYLGADLRSSFE